MKRILGNPLKILFLMNYLEGYDITIGKFKDKEVDFVCRKHDQTAYIQVHIFREESTIKREFGSLSKIDDKYPNYVLSMDEFDRSCQEIKHTNVIDFLKDEIKL
ncbi:MAG: ATP-binding protein [Methanobrevibacter sp.]|nr:ATP-binding protein [Candidatus Methanovirga basalitermitum]